MNATHIATGCRLNAGFRTKDEKKRTRENLCALSAAEAILRVFVKSARTAVSFSVSPGVTPKRYPPPFLTRGLTGNLIQ
jgi:hypothetical protein